MGTSVLTHRIHQYRHIGYFRLNTSTTYVRLWRPGEAGDFTRRLNEAYGRVGVADAEEEDGLVTGAGSERLGLAVQADTRHRAVVRLEGLLQCQLTLILNEAVKQCGEQVVKTGLDRSLRLQLPPPQ